LEFGIDLRELGLKTVFTTAEPLLPHQRDLIQETTGCKCVNQYGSAEGGFTAFECPEGNLHLNVESAWLQLQDTGVTEGTALVTDMFLRAFPLVNYGMEDEVSLGNGVCTCGRAHPILRSVNGRSGEPITLPNGKRINANLPSYIFKPLADLRVIQRYRFIQKDNDLKLFLIVSHRFSDEHLRLIDQQTKKAFGNDIQYTTHIVSEMDALPNAKHKCFVVIPENAE
jgi:phenylacetate-CoA ligase